MTAQETNVVNAVSTNLAATMAAGATSLVFDSVSGFPAVPFYIVVDPDVPAKREYMLIDSSLVGTTGSMTSTSKRNLSGSAGDVEHTSGAVVRVSPPMRQLFDDIHDRIDGSFPKSLADDAGDTFYADGADSIAKLAKGTTGDFYKQGASAPEWAAITTSDISDYATATDERARDALGTALTAGSGITITPNDGADTITIAATGAATAARKTANESVTSSTTLQNDDHLLIAVAASEVWAFEVVLFVDAANSTNGDIKVGFTVPAAATLAWGGIGAGVTGSGEPAAATEVAVFGGLDASGTASFEVSDTTSIVLLRGVIVNGANAGNLQLQWAQATSSGFSTVVEANSHLTAQKIT